MIQIIDEQYTMIALAIFAVMILAMIAAIWLFIQGEKKYYKEFKGYGD